MTPLRLLLIEDREDDAALVVRELSLAGYDVMSARVDTPDALRAALTRQPWDVAIAEDTMPRFRGTAALSLLRTYDAEVPFIFLSGTIGEQPAAAALKTGASDYVAKGNLPGLVPAIERELLFRGLDGQEIEVLEACWHVEICGVQTVDDHHWVQIMLDGQPTYPLTLKIPHDADATDATRAIRRWLLSPERDEGGVIAVEAPHRRQD
jgi:CheY-like chemotaxis protein